MPPTPASGSRDGTRPSGAATGTAGLGDIIHNALSSVGVTPALVTKWLGKECGCEERRERLNSLTFWARRVVSGKAARAAEFLNALMGGG